jgi:hypothetical protein
MAAPTPRELRTAQLTRRNIAEAIIAVVNATPKGAAPDRLYEPLKEHLARVEFDTLMRSLVYAERIAKRGSRFYPTPADSAGRG